VNHNYSAIFWELIKTPFKHPDMIWGIIPLYFGWLLNEITSGKASFRTAIQTGFGFIWAAAHWMFQYLYNRPFWSPKVSLNALFAVNVMVTIIVFAIGLLALISGLRRKFPRYCEFLGHSRFSNYFMIAIFPIQSQALDWSWQRVIAIVLFAVPIWLIVHFALLPWRK
jgi:hypothetical protein